MFYSKFTEDYEQIFPFNLKVFSFLKSYLASEDDKILDIGCASGHYCGRFAEEGYRIKGIDIDADMISTAVKTYPESDFKVLDLMDIALMNSEFDMVYSTGNVMAHISQDNFKTFLKSLKNIMSDGGIWVFQVINWDYILTQDNFTFSEIETKERIFLRHYSEISRNTLVFGTELKNKINGQSVFKDRVTMYPVPSEQYLSIHTDAGFELLGHFSDYGKSSFIGSKFSADIYVFKLKK